MFKMSYSRLAPLFFGILLGAGIVAPQQSVAAENNSSWHPQASERLVKLPTKHLEKTIARDFADSSLRRAIDTKDEEVSLKVQTVKDLKGAIESADGEIRMELRHQLLAQKRDLLNLLSKRNELKRKHLQTKSRLFGRILDTINEEQAIESPAAQTLVTRQEAAQERFKSTFKDIDMKLFENSTGPESRYAQKYDENLRAIEKLMRRTETHKMNAVSEETAVDKKTFVQRLLSSTQGEAALVEQEEKIVGYMAKLLSLDALELSEQASDAELADSDLAAPTGAAVVVDLFTND